MSGAARADHEVDFSRYTRIKASRQGRVLTLALSNPALMNAVDGEMHRELSTIFLDAADDKLSDVIVLTGDGAAFSAGCLILKNRSSPKCAGLLSGSGPQSR